MKILVTDSPGFVGKPLVRALKKVGHQIVRPSRNRDLVMDLDSATRDADAVIHLSTVKVLGENSEPPLNEDAPYD